jgi:hypothetical protein
MGNLVPTAALVVTLAIAGGPSDDIVVATPVVEGKMGQQNRIRLRESLMESLQGAQEAPEDAPACDEPQCAAELATSTGASQVITWQVVAHGRDFETKVTLREGSTGEAVASSERSCEICGIAEVSDLLSEQAAAMSRRAEAGVPARLSVQTQPSGARVRIDGELVGITPFEGPMPAGKHEMSIERDGYITRTVELDLVEAVVEKRHMDLQPVPEVKRTFTPMQIGGTVALVLGVGATATGAAFVALHHQPVESKCTGDNIDDAGVCKYRFNGLPSGIPLLAIGVAGIATGIALFVVDANRKKKKRVDERAHVRPWGAGLQVRF